MRGKSLVCGNLWLAGISLAVVLSACSSSKPDPFIGWFAPYRDCREDYAYIDKKIDEAGVRDASYYRVPGYPYLRTDRTLASFAGEVHGVNQIGDWLRHMRENDQESREYELENLGLPLQERADWRGRLLDCGRGLEAIELSTPEALDKLRALVKPPDIYSGARRILGMNPLVRPFVQSEVAARRERLLAPFADPRTNDRVPSETVLWAASRDEDPIDPRQVIPAAVTDELGFPGLTMSQWKSLAEAYAPALLLSARDPGDRPGAPVWTDKGVAVDASRPEAYFRISFARAGDDRLVQINYFYWFDTPQAAGSRPIDGFIWRATLDSRGQLLTREYMRMTGGDILWFPAGPMPLREKSHDGHLPALVPQGSIPRSPVALQLTTGSRQLRHVEGFPDVLAQAGSQQRYALKPYETLFYLPTPGGGTRSLFGPDGLIPGTESRPASMLLALAGVQAPGALRQVGHFPVDYVRRIQFDDVGLIDRFFDRDHGQVARANR